MVPAGKVFMHGLSGSSAHRVGVLPNLRSDVEQRDHDRKSADDLSEIGEIVEIHGFQLQPRGQLRSIAPTYANSGAEQAKSFATSKNPLLHICDLYDAAL